VARSLGAVTRLGVEARTLLVERDRVVGVETSDGTVESETTVVAGGPWSDRLLRTAGVELPLRVVRPENHFLAMPAQVPAAACEVDDPGPGLGLDVHLSRFDQEERAELGLGRGDLHPVLIDLEHGFYARAVPDERSTRVGHLEYDADRVLDDPDALDEAVDPATKRWARAALSSRLPDYRDQPDARSLAAWYTLTPDAQAIIGPVSGAAGALGGLLVVTGFSGHGFKLAPSVGEGVRQMLFGEAVSAFDPAFFSATRFHADQGWGGRFGL
jgi:glycine/D-amino acid oxidase-like deaminating enzyme